MTVIWGFIKYALWCVGNMFASSVGRGEITGNWLRDTVVGFLTLIIILILLYWIFRFTGLLKVEK